jgi:hypothetical protein
MNGSHFHSFGSGLPWYGPRILVIGAFLLAGGTYDRFAAGATLQELFNGSSIIAGDSQISDWELISLDSTAAVKPDLSLIDVVPLVSDLSNPGLQFTANGQLQISGVEAIDLVFKFRVDALAGNNSFTNHALALDGIRFGGTGGLANITGEVTNRFGGDLGSTQVFADIKSNSTKSLDTSDFAPQSEVSVISKVFIQGLSTTDAINLASFTQSFSQTGPAVLPGDFNHDKVVDTADIQAMLTALTDLNSYQAARGLSDDALLLLGDLNGDHAVTNADLRPLLDLVAAGGGKFAAVPEPASVALATLGVLSLVASAALMRIRCSVGDHALRM